MVVNFISQLPDQISQIILQGLNHEIGIGHLVKAFRRGQHVVSLYQLLRLKVHLNIAPELLKELNQAFPEVKKQLIVGKGFKNKEEVVRLKSGEILKCYIEVYDSNKHSSAAMTCIKPYPCSPHRCFLCKNRV